MNSTHNQPLEHPKKILFIKSVEKKDEEKANNVFLSCDTNSSLCENKLHCISNDFKHDLTFKYSRKNRPECNTISLYISF